jgi:pimeloyl-ACP methyl ester carboxylesterase
MSVRNDFELMSRVSDMAEKTQALIGAQTELALSRPDATEHLRTANLPLVFVTGREDQMTPPQPITDIGATARNAYVEVLKGLGHFALLEAPDRVARAVENGLSAVLKDDENVS